TVGPPASRRRARRSHAPSRDLRNTRPAAAGSTGRGPDSVVPSRGRRTAGSALPPTGRSQRRRGSRSIARRTDGPGTPATRSRQSTSALVRSCVCPSPWLAVYDPARQWRRHFIHFHHGLLGQRATVPSLISLPAPAPHCPPLFTSFHQGRLGRRAAPPSVTSFPLPATLSAVRLANPGACVT